MRWWLIPMVVCAAAAPLQAQGWIDPVRPNRDFGIHRLRTVVAVHVVGRIANVEVEEWFRNDGPALGEGDYLYPLPGEAVFSNFSLFQGDRELRGETMDAAKARAIYEEIVRRKRDPALIELVDHGLLRARVFPIAAGETRKITLRYTQVLSRAGDALQFAYAAGNRHQGIADIVNRDVVNQPPTESTTLTFTLVIDDATGFSNPFSPTHEVRVQRSGRRLTLRPESTLAGDFTVFLPMKSGAVGLALATHRPSSEPGYFMLTLSPAKVAELRAVPRDVTVVVDVSGSMSGQKIEQARAALHALLESLSPGDRFRLIAFSDQVRLYRNEWLTGARTNIDEANRWVDGLRAEGGTNISGALDEAFQATTPASRLPFIIFITDGLPLIGEQNPERIAERVERARGRTRIFAFGVGYDVNTYLLDRLSAAARGTTQYMRPGESVERPIAALAAKIRYPVLTDLKIGNASARLDEIYPAELPDLFVDEELVIVGRYRASSKGEVTITGSRAGHSESFSTQADFPAHQLGNDYIPRIWASRKVGYLSQQLKLHGANDEIVQSLRETALRYGILSEYTSYLVQEPGVFANNPGPMPPVAPAGEPRALTGQAAVASAESSRARREVKTSNAVDLASAAQDASQSRANVRSVGGRAFHQTKGAWTDSRHVEGRLDVMTVEPFSEAYFALLRALPELEAYWKTLGNVLVTGRSASIKVAAGGIKQIDAGRIAAIVKRFRT